MAGTEIKVQMQQRRDTASGWTSADPTLLSGELGYETDTGKFKIGDGSTAWSSLDYLRSSIEWTLTANGTTDYIFAGPGFAGTETDPTIYVVRGQYYKFTNAMGAHPFQIQSTQGAGGTAYNDGIINNGVSNGTLTWEVRMDAPSTLYYQCTSHALMAGVIYVLDEGSSVASIDDLGDVDTTTVAPTDGQALVWDNAASKWEPGTVSGGGGASAIDDLSDVDTSTIAPTNGQVLTWDGSQWEPATPTTSGLPTAQDGEALIYENGQWVAGPVIGGVNYTTAGAQVSNYTPPSGFSPWNDSLITGLQQGSGGTLSNNNLTYTAIGSSAEKIAGSASTKSTGKYYWEFVWDAGANPLIGVATNLNVLLHQNSGTVFAGNSGVWYNNNGGTTVNLTGTYSVGDVIGFAIDFDAKKMWVAQNGTWENSGDPAAGTGAVWSGWTGTPDLYFAMRLYDPGDAVSVGNYQSTGTTTTILASDSIRTLLGIDEYASDSAAGTGGLSSGELYYNTTSSSYVLKT